MSRTGIREPKTLELPPHDVLQELVDRLNEASRKEFLEQLLDALIQAEDKNDLSGVEHLVGRWHRAGHPSGDEQSATVA